IRATACACRSKSQHVAPSDRERTPGWRRLVIESSCEIAARHRNCGIVPELEPRSDNRALERCAIRRITNEQVCDPVRDRIHGTGSDYAVLLHTAATGVLDGRQQARSLDVDHGLPALLKRTWSPMRSTVGGSRSGRNRCMSVRPMICQPPGVSSGYTPVWDPAIPTDPAGTDNLGDDLRGVAISGGRPARYGKPGTKPTMTTV